MTYRVQLTDQAKSDLRDIYEHIAFYLMEPGTAKKLRNRILNELKSLQQMPGRCPLYLDEPWKSRGLRRINIGSYSGFYLTTEKTIQVIRILYCGRDIAGILSDTVSQE